MGYVSILKYLITLNARKKGNTKFQHHTKNSKSDHNNQYSMFTKKLLNKRQQQLKIYIVIEIQLLKNYLRHSSTRIAEIKMENNGRILLETKDEMKKRNQYTQIWYLLKKDKYLILFKLILVRISLCLAW